MTKGTHQAALQSYLDALLTDNQQPESRVKTQSTETPGSLPATALMQRPAIRQQLSQVALREPLISEEVIKQLPVSPPVIEPKLGTATAAPIGGTAEPLSTVSWAQSAFECLLFEVAGLTLAVPLQALGSIYPFVADELTPLFGHPDWFLGILSRSAQHSTINVVDTARWVMPERYTAEMGENLKYVISIAGYDWELAVHGVQHVIRLEPEQVKWRTQRTKRGWLAGTVTEHMCALLDVEVLAQLITKQDRLDARV